MNTKIKIGIIISIIALLIPSIGFAGNQIASNTSVESGSIQNNVESKDGKFYPEQESVTLRKASDWIGYAMPVTQGSLDIYATNDTQSGVVGKIFSNTKAYVVEIKDNWTKICSGNVIGYTKSDTLLYDNSAEALMIKRCSAVANIITYTKVYAKDSKKSDVLGEVGVTAQLPVLGKEDNWTKVLFNNNEAYVLSAKTSVTYDLRDGQTLEEIEGAAAQQESVEESAGSGLNMISGVNFFNGRRETYYSSNVLYHVNTDNWVIDSEGFYHEPVTGAYVVAASDLSYGTIFYGSKGKCIVLDCGCDPYTTDYYVAW